MSDTAREFPSMHRATAATHHRVHHRAHHQAHRVAPSDTHPGGHHRPVQVAAALLLTGLLLLLATPDRAAGQDAGLSIGSGVHFQGFSFDEALGTSSANLFLVPLAVRVPLGSGRFTTDVYGGWATGSVERDGVAYTLSGPVDTQVRAQFAATPWAVLTFGVNLPTGESRHDAGEALVASVLATDMLGFREASWGTGFAVTSGVATARRMGAWGIGAGLSHRMASEFEPSADAALAYTPGSETRARLGIDRTVGASGKLTSGVTFQRFSADQMDGRNLFQSGDRIRVDLAWAFRTGASTWTAYTANMWREQGDVSLPELDGSGEVVGEVNFRTGSQNLFLLGLNGSVPVGATQRIRPAVDFRMQSREEGPGSGWLVAVGGDIPLRIAQGYDVFPRAQFLIGRMENSVGSQHQVIGGEAGLSLRWRR